MPFELCGDQRRDAERRECDGADDERPPEQVVRGVTDPLEKQIPRRMRNGPQSDEAENDWANC